MVPILVISSVLLWIIVLVNVLLTIALIRRLNQMSSMTFPDDEGLAKGTPAPDFTAETLTGEMVTLAHYAHKVVSFIFISPTCGPCVEKLPTMNDLATTARQAGVELVLVSTDGEKAAMAALVQKHHVTVPLLFAPLDHNPFARDYKAESTPFYCQLNQDGSVESSGFFGPDWEQQVTRAPSMT